MAIAVAHAEAGRRITTSRLLAAMSAAALAAFLIVDLGSPRQAKSSVEQTPPAKSAWIAAVRVNGAYAITSPMLHGLELHYLTRRHREGGGRQDILSFGASENTAAAFARVAIYRPGTEGVVSIDAVEAIAAVAADSSIDAELTGPSGMVLTKFGELSAVEMTLNAKAGPRNCLAVAGRFDDPALGLVAWYCNPGVEIVGYGQVACMLDRLALVSSGRDEKLIGFFARAELNRSFCDVKSPLLGNAPRATDWIDQKAGPRLRGKFTSR